MPMRFKEDQRHLLISLCLIDKTTYRNCYVGERLKEVHATRHDSDNSSYAYKS